MPNSTVDLRIIEAVKSGQTSAFAEIIAEFEKPLIRYACRFTRTQADAEDIAQETFIKAYLHIGDFDLTKKFSTWLYTIATRTAYDWLRRKKRANEFLLTDEVSETIDPNQAYTIIDKHLDIGIALDKIKPSYKVILLLFYKDGFGYEEIAEILKLPLNTVKTHLFRAKQTLRQALETGA